MEIDSAVNRNFICGFSGNGGMCSLWMHLTQ